MTCVVNNAKRNAPVDTGHLVGNIKYDPFIQEKRVEIRSDADYSGYVEFGTRSQSAQPYFVPAIRLAVRNLKKDLDRLIKKAIS